MKTFISLDLLSFRTTFTKIQMERQTKSHRWTSFLLNTTSQETFQHKKGVIKEKAKSKYYFYPEKWQQQKWNFLNCVFFSSLCCVVLLSSFSSFLFSVLISFSFSSKFCLLLIIPMIRIEFFIFSVIRRNSSTIYHVSRKWTKREKNMTDNQALDKKRGQAN